MVARRIELSETQAQRLDELARGYAIQVTTDNREVARAAGLVVLSVKRH